jgi:hypothetical protein
VFSRAVTRPLSLVVACLLAGLVVACGSSSDTVSTPAAPVAESQAAVPGEAWQKMPVVPAFNLAAKARLRQAVARADRAGLRAQVFAKVGDSNTEWEQNLYGLGCRPVDFGPRPGLAAVQQRYTAVPLEGLRTFPGCEPANSFSRMSAATVSGVWTEWLITPVEQLNSSGSIAASDECEPAWTPLECELELTRPRYATIMIGTNDALIGLQLGDVYKSHLTDLIREVRASRTVPVLSTLPPMPIPTAGGQDGEDRINEANGIIREVSQEMKVPLINLFRAMTGPEMENQGLASDQLHLGVFGGESSPDMLANSAILTPEALVYGANRRQLVWLQTLKRLDSIAGSSSAG